MAVRAIALLPALTGSWKEIGGGLQLSTSQAFHLNRAGLERADLQQRRAGPRGAHRQHVAAGAGAHRAGRSAGEGDGGLQLEPRRHRAQSERRARAGCAATICSPWCWSSSRPTPPITPTSCCPPPLSWNTPTSTSPTATITCNWRGRRCPPPGEARSNVEIFRLLAARMGFDDACFGDSEDDMIRTLLDSPHPFVQRHHAGGAGPRALRAAADVRRRGRSCLSPRAASARPTASAISTPRRWTTRRRWNRATATPALRRNIRWS